ncbi:MAG: DUF3108 domain-containing protein [Xylophilus ampelinus]
MPSLRRLLPVLLLVVCAHLAVYDALRGLGRTARPATPPDGAPPVLLAEILPPAPAAAAPAPDPPAAPPRTAAAAPRVPPARHAAPRRVAPARPAAATAAVPAPAAAPAPAPAAEDAPPAAPVPVAAEAEGAPTEAPAAAGGDQAAPGAGESSAATAASPGADGTAPQAAAAPARLPGPMELRYAVTGHVKGFDYQAHATLRWRHDGERYDARFELGAFLLGTRVQTSTGAVGPGGLAPLRFADRTRSERAAHFDYAARRISFSANTPDAPLQPGAQDRLSVILQVAALLGADPGRYPEGATLSMQTASARSAETWTFRRAETADLALPDGPVPAVRLVRAPRRDFDDTVEVWLAPGLGWLPVRLRFTQAGGDVVDQILQDRMPLP